MPQNYPTLGGKKLDLHPTSHQSLVEGHWWLWEGLINSIEFWTLVVRESPQAKKGI